jgi:hemerythrin
MAFIEWDNTLSVNVKEFDDQHKKLIDIVNVLHDAMKQGKSKDVIGDVVTKLRRYTQQHFAAEEKHLERHGFPGFEAHRAQHNKFIEQVLDLGEQIAGGQIPSTIEVMRFLREWLVKHIQGTDKAYGPFLNEKGVR